MARARSIRNYTDSELVNLMSDDAERTFARLLTVADRDGNLFAHPTKLNKLLFPLKTYRDFQISTWIKELATEHIIPPSKKPTALLHLYEVNGKSYLHINKYGQTHKGEKPIYPPPPEGEVEEEDELEPEGKTEGEENPRASSFLKINGNTEKQESKTANTKSSNEISLRGATVENEEWIKETARLQRKPVSQVKGFCELWIQKKVHLGSINHEKATVPNLIKFMFEDLDKQNAAPLSQQQISEPEPVKVYDIEAISNKNFQRIKREFSDYKKSGKLQILAPLQTLSELEKRGLIKTNSEERTAWIEKATSMVRGTSNKEGIKPVIYHEFRKLLRLRESLERGTLTALQQNEIKSIAAEMEIRDFYDGVEELEEQEVAP